MSQERPSTAVDIVSVNAVDTEYGDFCFSKADLLAQGVPDNQNGLQVIAFEPIVSPAAVKYVHHFVVTATSDTSSDVCTPGDDDDGDSASFMEMVNGTSFTSTKLQYYQPESQTLTLR